MQDDKLTFYRLCNVEHDEKTMSRPLQNRPFHKIVKYDGKLHTFVLNFRS